MSDCRRATVSVVTGASRGLGVAVANNLLSRGHAVAVCARTTPRVDGALCRSVDVTDLQAVASFAAEVVAELGPIDVWVNNAGLIGPIGRVSEIDPSQWRECIEVNIMGTLHGSQAFLAHCSSHSVLINISSRAGVTGVAGLAAYSASKAAIIALTQSIAAESPGHVSAYVILPPSTDTAMQRGLLAQDERSFPGVVDSRRRRDSGEILSTGNAAGAILRSILDDQPGETVVDLTTVAS